MRNLLPFLNPLAWFKAFRFAKRNSKYDRSTFDLELSLYSKVLSNNMLHYGYFEDINTAPETISAKQFEDAQILYASNIIEHIVDTDNPVLDVGCGMGGLSQMIYNQGFKVDSLTPNRNQIEYINTFQPQLSTYHCKYEQFNADKMYGTIINSESLQYISLSEAFIKTNSIVVPNARWIIVDYFSLEKGAEDQKPHHLETFYQKSKEYGWRVTYEKDITLNVLPSLAFLDMYVNRFLLPLKHFTYEKLRFKLPKFYYLSEQIRSSIDAKIEREIRTVDPDVFRKERRYMMIVLDRE